MTVRENVHRIVDTLPDERLEDVLDYLAELSEPDEPSSGETRAAIKEGLNDIRQRPHNPAGRVPADARSVKYEVRLSHRPGRDFDRLDKPTQKRIVRRMEQLAADPYGPRISAPLSGAADLRTSRVGAWRIIWR